MKVFWAKSKWFFLAAAGVCLMIFGVILRGLFHSPKDTPSGTGRLPEVPRPLQEKVRKAEEAAMIAKAESKLTAEVKINELNEIKKIDDGAERRKKLAELLKDV